ncbi:hypothetical protein [Puia sp.]|jgi:hypothetical protein|uniref:hypothetical protein n=1 Tax=Puia sp. TaxID=2045100 RepID=UPI002F3FC317
MKKALVLTAIVCFSLLTAKAQLTNSKWKGVLKIPNDNGDLMATPVTWDFSNDTATVSYDNGNVPDVMTYKVEKNAISFKKVSGNVPCDNDMVLVCSFEIKNDQLFLKQIQDACKARATVDVSQPFDRVK